MYNIQFPSNIFYFYIAINSSVVNHAALTYSLPLITPLPKFCEAVSVYPVYCNCIDIDCSDYKFSGSLQHALSAPFKEPLKVEGTSLPLFHVAS